MEINEHIILQDIPSSRMGKYHSAVMTTFSIDLIDFDNHVLNTLHGKQISSINVLVDSKQLEQVVELVNPQYLTNVGREYSLTGIESKGAFHPKINFLIGDNSILILFGSGNLTAMGQGKNHEAFTGLWLDQDNQTHMELVRECWAYLARFVAASGKYETNRILNEIPQNCEFLNSAFNVIPHKNCEINTKLDATLLYNDNSSIISQMMGVIPSDEVTRVTVVSPFFDEDGSTLLLLTKLCPNARIDVLMQESCELPPVKLKDNSRILFYDFDKTERGKHNTLNCYERRLHAKIFHFKTEKMEYCVIGSANATQAGVGTLNKRGNNDEFCILYSSKSRDFLGELGLKKKVRLITKPNSMKRTFEESMVNDSPNRHYKILSAEFVEGVVGIKMNDIIPNDVLMIIDNGWEQQLVSLNPQGDRDYNGSYNIGDKTAVCYLIDDRGNIISNRIFINRLSYLEQTSPSPSTRSLNRAISQIEANGIEGFEIVDLLNDIILNYSDDVNERLKARHASNSQRHKQDTDLPDIKYDPDFDNDDVQSSRLRRHDSTSKLLDCIEETFKRKIQSISEDQIDEEELASPEASNDRAEKMDKQIKVSIHKEGIYYPQEVRRIAQSYIHYADRRMSYMKETGNYMISNDDLNLFSLAMFTSIKVAYLDRMNYVFEGNDRTPIFVNQKNFYDDLDNVMHGEVLETLERICSICEKGEIVDKDDYGCQRKIQRSLKYAILYATLFNKFANIHIPSTYMNNILKYLKTLLYYLGNPDMENLNEDLSVLSERNECIFRMCHVNKILSKVESFK